MSGSFAGAREVAAVIGVGGLENNVRPLIDGNDLDSRSQMHAIIKEQPNFTRVGTVQEGMLASELVLYFGSCRLFWHKVDLDFEHQQLGPRPSVENYSHTIEEEPVAQQVWRESQARREELSERLINYRHGECHDPRDKIYGLSSLATNLHRLQNGPRG